MVYVTNEDFRTIFKPDKIAAAALASRLYDEDYSQPYKIAIRWLCARLYSLTERV